MDRKSQLFRSPIRRIAERYGVLGSSNVSVRIIAIVLLTIFVPSVLITALGIVAVYRAEPILRQWVEHPYRLLLSEVDQRLGRRWNAHLVRLAAEVESTDRLQRTLLELVEEEPYVDDALLFEAGDFRSIEPESPFVQLEAPTVHPILEQAQALEFRQAQPIAALELYERLADSPEPEVAVEGLLGAARVQSTLGQPRDAVRPLRRLTERFGDSHDGSGIPYALPALWRLVELHLETTNLVSATGAARELRRHLERWETWLAPADTAYFRSRLEQFQRQTGAFPDVGGSLDLEPPISRLILDETRRRQLVDHASGLDVGERRGYLELRDSDAQIVKSLAWVRVGGSPRVAYLVLNEERFLEDARLFTIELEIPDELFSAARRPTGAASARDQRPSVISSPYPHPFSDWEMRYSPTPEQIPQELRGLDALETTGFIWGLVVLVLTILLGLLITVRSILHEMHVSNLKTDFVSFVTHELKTPLTAIRMFTETLLAERVRNDEERTQCVELIDKEAARLSRLIEQILEFSKIQQRKFVLSFSSCDMSEVVGEAVDLFREQNPDSGVEVTVNQAQHMSKIRMDRSAMVELLLNLLSNALKYTKRKDKRIIVNLKESIDDILVEVVDFGVGIPKSEQRKIFDKFYRAEDLLTRDVDGTGLGLAFAKYIAKVHNGEIKVTSAVNQGSTFTLELRKNQILAE